MFLVYANLKICIGFAYKDRITPPNNPQKRTCYMAYIKKKAATLFVTA